jgi:hypothetical protein
MPVRNTAAPQRIPAVNAKALTLSPMVFLLLPPVRVFAPQAAVVQDYIPVVDIIAKPPTAEAQPVLPFPLPNALQFSYGVVAAAVIRISAEKAMAAAKRSVRSECGRLSERSNRSERGVVRTVYAELVINQ